MDLRGVIAAKYDGTDIFGIWLGTVFIWPDPWMDIWDDGGVSYWTDEWRNMWSTLPAEGAMIREESVSGNK